MFDRFEGAGVPDGQVSLAIEVSLQPGEKSFTETELKAISDRILAARGKGGGHSQDLITAGLGIPHARPSSSPPQPIAPGRR